MRTTMLYGNQEQRVMAPPANARCSLQLAEFVKRELNITASLTVIMDALDAAARAHPNLISLRDPR